MPKRKTSDLPSYIDRERDHVHPGEGPSDKTYPEPNPTQRRPGDGGLHPDPSNGEWLEYEGGPGDGEPEEDE